MECDFDLHANCDGFPCIVLRWSKFPRLNSLNCFLVEFFPQTFHENNFLRFSLKRYFNIQNYRTLHPLEFSPFRIISRRAIKCKPVFQHRSPLRAEYSLWRIRPVSNPERRPATPKLRDAKYTEHKREKICSRTFSCWLLYQNRAQALRRDSR